MMASLYELSAYYTSMLDAYDGAETEQDREEIIEALEGAGGDIAEKAEAYAKVIRTKEAEARAFKDEADRLSAKQSACENMVKRLKAALLDAMKLTDMVEIKTSIGKWRLQNNPVSCQVVDLDAVPMEYHIKHEDTIDRKAVLQHYKATGELLPGVEIRQEMGIRFR